MVSWNLNTLRFGSVMKDTPTAHPLVSWNLNTLRFGSVMKDTPTAHPLRFGDWIPTLKLVLGDVLKDSSHG